MISIWYLIAGAALVVFMVRRDLRRQMVLAMLFAAPLVIIQPLLTGHWVLSGRGWALLATQCVTVASLAALASVLYLVLVNARLTPFVHPDRRHLGWLVLTPVATIAVSFVIHWPMAIGLLAAFFLDLAAIAFIRRDLLWDMVVSCAGFGFLYAVLFLTATVVAPGDWSPIILSRESIGITVFSVPVEELLFVIFLGAVIGPLYAATKHVRITPTETVGVGPQRKKKVLGIMVLAVSALVTIWAVVIVVIPPKVSASVPTSAVPLTFQPSIHFSRPVSRQRISVEITPFVDGQVVFEDPALGGHAYRTARFVPTVPFEPSTPYVVAFSGIGSLAGLGNASTTVRYTTVTYPTVAAIGSAAPVNPCGPFLAVLDRASDATASFSFTLEPDGALDAVLGDDRKTFQLTPTACLRQGAPYTVKAWRQIILPSSDGLTTLTSDRVLVATVPVTTVAEPTAVTVVPSGQDVPLATPTITVTFAEDMHPDSVLQHLTITPTPVGAWSSTDARHFVYTATAPLASATTYRVTVAAGTTSASGGFVTADLTSGFTTIGPIAVASVFPANGTTGYTVDGHVRITFDQSVDQLSAAGSFSIAPPVSGDIIWQGNTLEFAPRAALQRNTTYTVTLVAGVTGPNALPLPATVTSAFTTEVTKVLLQIAVDYQDKALSCEAAALKMALAGKGVKVTEDAIMKHVGYDPTPHRGNVWGDPDKAFVGLITGKQNTTGYGVHWDPIAAAARHWRPATAFSGWTPVQLADAITKGNPVVIWGVVGRSYADPWKTPTGKKVAAWKGEHARTVVGFIGPASAPTAFIINDPYVGRITWTTAALVSNWATFGNSGVVVE